MSIRPVMAIALTSALLVGGCADLMARSTIAPDWFQAKAVEVKGEGYPSLSDVPQTRPLPRDWNQWRSQSEELKQTSAAMEKEFLEYGALATEEEIRASAAQLRALLGEQPAEGDESP